MVGPMARSTLDDAFAHNTWANLRLIDACAGLSAEQLDTVVPGTYGTIIGTFRHTIGAESWYRFRLLGDRFPPIAQEDEDRADLGELRALAAEIGESWPETFERDPDEVIVVKREDGSETHAPVGVRLSQVLHHGTDHRSQICTALTQLGIEPPEIDVWAYGVVTKRVTEIPPTT
jgi:uncharacterized damage-inducible protein DinB